MLLTIMVAAALPILVVMVMMFVLFFRFLGFQPLKFHFRKIRGQGSFSLHGSNQLLTGELVPGRGDDGSNTVMLPEHGHRPVQLGLRNGIRAGENDSGSRLHLVIIELTKILHIDLNLAGVRNGNCIAQGNIFAGDTVHGADHIGQLAHTGGLDQDPVRRILPNDPFQRLAKIAHQRAANAAGVHFGNVDARILQEAAVNADFTELVLDKNQLLALVAFGDHFLNEGRFARAEKTGININFCHILHLLYRMILFVLYHFLSTVTRAVPRKSRNHAKRIPRSRNPTVT